MEIGYWLSSEEYASNDLVQYARQAEEFGFTFVQISDHYHPLGRDGGNCPGGLL